MLVEPEGRTWRWLLTALAAVAIVACAGALLADSDTALVLDNIHWTASALAAFLFAHWRVQRCQGTAQLRGARWFRWGLALLLIGQVVWDVQVVVEWSGFPAPSDPFYLLTGPALALGLWFSVHDRLTASNGLTAKLDVAALTLASFTASMALLIPEQGEYSLVQLAILGGYPFGLIAPASLGLVMMLTLRARPSLASLLLPLCAAGFALCWVMWNLRFLEGRIGNGDWLNIGFSIVMLGMGAGALIYGPRGDADPRWDRWCEGLLRLLPLFLVVLAAGGIMLATLPGTDPRISAVAALGGGGAIVLAAVRQSLLLRERDRLVAAERLLRQREAELESRVEARTRALAEATAAAQAANRAKSDFLANMSHEIRTPLNSVLGLAHVALATATDPHQRLCLERIHRSGDQLLRLLEGILDMSRIEAGVVELEVAPFELDGVIRAVRSDMEPLALDRRLAMSFETDPLIPATLAGDAFRLRQVLTNLVGNALKFTPAGRVEVAAELVEQLADRCTVAVHVRDTGIGMDSDTAQRVFQPFQQADNSTTRRFGGTGLGLAICKDLVALMGGEIGVDSVQGQGSHFWFTARFGVVQPGQQPGATPPVPDADPERFQGAEILLVEDNELNQIVATSMLEQVGARVTIADTGQRAIDMLGDRSFDVVLMDVQMPDVDGTQVTRWMRTQPRLSSLAVIAMTANAGEDDMRRCLDAGMDDFISKPVRPKTLIDTVARWLKPAEARRGTGR